MLLTLPLLKNFTAFSSALGLQKIPSAFSNYFSFEK